MHTLFAEIIVTTCCKFREDYKISRQAKEKSFRQNTDIPMKTVNDMRC